MLNIKLVISNQIHRIDQFPELPSTRKALIDFGDAKKNTNVPKNHVYVRTIISIYLAKIPLK